ncbi:hypothetical protein O6H91_05G053800 [Diphasiastrum complanatum]|uniref:Uncharacterized protein n=2 Tax=Diphasiastrum complanatum TaxID=34168 RepID=A0ACC2DN92_DIPCM|nr:hypothetical protein O6H91_05G053800 [Diphasiastrum complanatum]KAJ7555762.1 hypothetical protein O6H91_05G053800 [Diphasiastrum complanatum]
MKLTKDIFAPFRHFFMLIASFSVLLLHLSGVRSAASQTLHLSRQASEIGTRDYNPVTQVSVAGHGLSEDVYVLNAVKSSFLQYNPIATSLFATWVDGDGAPCKWNGVQCSNGSTMNRVSGIDLSGRKLGGPIPLELANLTALSSLSLALNRLNGSIPQQLGDCLNLTYLNLTRNLLLGSIPPTLGNLSSLRSLDLSGNKLTGGIPPEMFLSCGEVRMVNLSNNPLGGELPSTIGNCKALIVLDLENANLEGGIPAEIGQLWSIRELILTNNNLTGEISSSLFDSCKDLQTLDLSWNRLSGNVPLEIGNCSQLSILSLSQNELISLTSQIGELKNLQWLFLGKNKFSGEIPAQISSCAALTMLDLKDNQFSGSIPPFLASLKQLEFLVMNGNNLIGEFPGELLSLPSLQYLDLSDNHLSGPIPPPLSNLSSILFLFLSGNQFSGVIPPQIDRLSSLQILDMSSNLLQGSIPSTIGNLQNMLWLLLAHNKLNGSIPQEIGSCRSLLWLNLANNSLTGNLPENMSSTGSQPNTTFNFNLQSLALLPKQLGECSILRKWLPSSDPPFASVAGIDDRNRCQAFWNLLVRGTFLSPLCPYGSSTQSIGYMQLSVNHLTGSIPRGLGQAQQLGLLFLDHNSFTDVIPAELSNLVLIGLNLSENQLTGPIPPSFGQMTCLQILDLSYNNLSGSIPSSLQSLTLLTRFNISYNHNLSGAIPTGQQFSTFDSNSYIGDELLCYNSVAGSKRNTSDSTIPSCDELPNAPGSPGSSHHLAHSAVSTGIAIGLSCLLGVFLISAAGYYIKGKKRSARKAENKEFMMVGKESKRFADASVQVSLFSIDLPKQLTYSDLLVATGNFDECNIIGSGGFGVVYKARLVDGSLVAIKKLIQEGPQADREFLAEMETLGHVHHDNLVPLLGCSTFGTEKLLVYKFMQNGSLDDWLHERQSGAETLEWPLRLNIALGMARGLKFLHHNCSPPIIHRDMKASNILLDKNFEPRLTDFGLARVLGAQDSHVSTVVAGTLGYVPPEYCQTWRATVKGDVYSFGVVLLELITGRRPMDMRYNAKNCGNLVEWVGVLLKEGKHRDIYHPILLKTGAPGELFKFLTLAICCTEELPSNRPTMREVLKTLEEIKAGNYTT